MDRGRNKLGNAFGLIGLLFLDMNTELLKLRILVAVQDLKISFCICKIQFSLVPPHFQFEPPQYVCFGDSTAVVVVVVV